MKLQTPTVFTAFATSVRVFLIDSDAVGLGLTNVHLFSYKVLGDDAGALRTSVLAVTSVKLLVVFFLSVPSHGTTGRWTRAEKCCLWLNGGQLWPWCCRHISTGPGVYKYGMISLLSGI